MQFGSTELYMVSDGLCWMDGGAAFGLVPRVLWEKVIPPDELHRVPTALNCLLIRSEGKNILVNTGLGNKLSDKQRKVFDLQRDGDLLEKLAALGLLPADIEVVINTHLHSDHCGGNTVPRGAEIVPTFPRAEYWIQRLEWSEACYPNERTRGTYLADNFRPLEEHGQLRLLYGDTRVTSEVRCVITRGHTRAHQSVVIESEGKTAIYLSEVAPFTANMERLAWVAAFDVEPLESIETKRRIMRWALEKEALLIFEHDTKIPLGYLREQERQYKVEALE